MKITFLGCGTSNGVPIIGCKCPVCTSDNPKNKKFRCCLAVETSRGRIVIDTPPEFRLQCIRENISSLDAVLLTHDHADHIMGFDDIRGFTAITNKAMPVYGSYDTIKTIKKDFLYMFTKPINKSLIAKVDTHIINKNPIRLIGENFIPVPIKHGNLEIFAYKFRNVMYCTDCSYIPKPSRKLFKNLDILIIDACTFYPHPTHFNFRQTLKIIDIYKPKKAYLTHCSHYYDYDEISALLPENVYMTYDGLQISV